MSLDITKTNKKNILIIIAILSFFRIGLFARMPYASIGYLAYDDVNMIQLADYLSNGWWLGDYSYTTLIKGVSFPLFVAISKIICIPYSVLLGGLYILAGIVTSILVYELYENILFSSVSYLFILYSPIGFITFITNRLYRNAILFPVIIILFCSIILVFITRSKSLKHQLPYLLLMGGVFIILLLYTRRLYMDLAFCSMLVNYFYNLVYYFL